MTVNITDLQNRVAAINYVRIGLDTPSPEGVDGYHLVTSTGSAGLKFRRYRDNGTHWDVWILCPEEPHIMLHMLEAFRAGIMDHTAR